jgi:DNA-binding transcriptional LysR family regulator
VAIDLFQLETFLAVAREGSFSRAAQNLLRTQPAVSQTIRRLEEDLGEALFDRSSRNGTLTDAGLVLQDYAEKLLNMRGEAVGAIEALRHLQRGKLAVAANEFTCIYLLGLLHEFRRLHAMVHVCVQRTLASRVPNEVLNRNAEMGVVTFRPDSPELKSLVVYRDELAFVVPPQHPLAHARQLGIRQLGSEMFVAHNVASPYRDKVLQTFAQRKVPLNMEVELPSIEAIKKFVAAGNGVALLPLITVETEVQRGDLVHVPVPELRFERKLRIIFRKNVALSHAARAFLAIAESFARERAGRYVYHAER